MRRTQEKRSILRAATAFLSAALFMGLTVVPNASAASMSRTIRIPYGFNDFLREGQDGVTGYYAEYLEKLAEVNNWEYEYVEATWSEALNMLEDGEVDLLYPVNYSEDREASMDYSTLPNGYMVTGIFALKDGDYCYEDYASFDGARIACVRGSANLSELENFAAKHGFSFEVVYPDTTEELTDMLRNGQADLAVSNALNIFPDCALVATMDARPVYLTVREGNSALLTELNDGMQRLLKQDTDMVLETVQNTLVGSGGQALALTKEERAFIETDSSVTVGFYTESAPLSYLDEDGSYNGVYPEFLGTLAEKTGLDITPYPIDPDRNWKELLRTGEIDFYIGASDVIVSQDDDIVTSEPFMSYSNTLVTRNDCAFGQLDVPVIAITYSRANWGDYMKTHLSRNLEIQYYQTTKECMLAVAKGDADASLINNLEFNYQSKNPRLSGLIQWSLYRFPTEVSLAASDQTDPALLSIVNKGINQIPSNYLDAVKEEYLNMTYGSFSTADILYNARIPLILGACVFLLAAGILITVRIARKNKEKAEKISRERERHQLQALAAMSQDYAAISYVDLDKDSFECLQLQGIGVEDLPRHGCFSEITQKYIREGIGSEYLDELLPLCEPAELIRRFQNQGTISFRYQIPPGRRSGECYEMHFVNPEADGERHRMVFGIRCVDSLVREEQERRRILQDALDSANMANVAKSEFLSRMSHDIRTPMNAIIGMTVIAATHADDPERVRDSLNKISGASRYLLSLINDVLDMSKIESGKLTLAEENINLSELIGSFLELIQPRVKEHRHDLKVSVQNVKHEAVIGDSLRLQQVFVNIMDNAVKYTPDGGELSLTVREVPVNTTSAGCYEFVFADNGIGMSEEFQKHIFDPFQREEDLRISKIQGTGLGMSITQNIVHMMNGSIKVESELGKGSVFTVTVFLKLQDQADADLSEFADIPVLVADDDKDACESVCAMLEEISMAATGCTSGQEAVNAVRLSLEERRPFYAVILDWKMPNMDGVETAREIRRIIGDSLPIIILSAYDWSEIEEEARAAGVDAFLSKPVFKSGIIRLFKSFRNRESSDEEMILPDQLSSENYAGRRVLLVEDNPLNREIAKEILEMTGLTVDEAEDGQDALNRFSTSPEGFYQMIFMDIQMPVMNGYEATGAIRALDRGDAKSVPILAMTANAFVEDIQKSKATGMNEHLAKPIDMEKLKKILKKYLG